MTLSIVRPDETPESLLIARIKNAWMNTRGYRADWVDATLDLAQALAEARALKKSDQAFGYWLDQNGFADITHQDRAALIGMAGDLVAARKMLEATDRTSWRVIWEKERQAWFTNVGKPPQSAKLSAKHSARAAKVSTSEQAQEINDVLIRRDQGFRPIQIADDLGLSRGKVAGILSRNKDKVPTPTAAPLPVKPVPTWHTEYQGLKTLTREQVDPDFKGDDVEFATEYGHVNLFTKAQIEANKEAQALTELCDALTEASKKFAAIKRLPKPETVQAWLAKPKKKERLAEWLEPIEKALILINKGLDQ